MTAGRDPRWDLVGELLVRRATSVRPGERVMIAMGEAETLPLLQGVYRSCIRAGAYPQVQFLSEALRDTLLREGSEQQLAWVPELESYGMDWADVYIGLRGAYPLAVHDGVPAQRLAINQTAQGTISAKRWAGTRWTLVRVPGPAMAQEAGIGLDRLLDMFFDACLLDWDAARERWQGWADTLQLGSEVQILGAGTDLSFSTAGRGWLVSAGGINNPDGEIMTAPITGSVHGEIRFVNPGVFGGRLMRDLRLRWDHGVLVEARAATNQDFLESVLATDDGATAIGEFGIGTNPKLSVFCNDILLDEKIAGTVHIALGRAYPECGGTNRSALHWDIVQDLRPGGELRLDGRTVIDDGRILLP